MAVAAGGAEHGDAAAAAPHRQRRMVDGTAGAGPWAGLWSAVEGRGAGMAQLAGAVCRLHAVAAFLFLFSQLLPLPQRVISLPVQYADYTLWEREELGEEEEEGSQMALQLKYWKGRLAGLPEEMNVARDHGRTAVSSQRGESIRLRMEGELHEGLLRVG